MKLLYGYPYFRSENTYGNVEQLTFDYIEILKKSGFDVEPFCLTLNPPGPCLSFPELDSKWRNKDKTLLKMYDNLQRKLEGKDVFINSVGINLHPEFVARLKVFTIFECNDDPENSGNLSKPAAYAYNLSLVGNAAEIGTYRSWGVKNVEWGPIGLGTEIYDKTLTEDDILNKKDIPLFMMSDRTSPWRRSRLDKLLSAFPKANFYGNGWPLGYLPRENQLSMMKRAKIGPNLHNSTGPINYRFFYLPANGIMQICDNKKHLGIAYEVGKEIIGFDTVEECIDLCRYYMDHDEERKKIAVAGWKRAIRDYTEVAVFKRLVGLVEKYKGKK